MKSLAPPRGETASPELKAQVFAVLERGIAHPLADPVLSAARRLAAGGELSVPEAVFLLRQIAQYPGQYAALSIAYLGCDDAAGVADQEQARIRQSWDAI